MPQYITYIRVSTQQQGKSGLGLEAQRAAISAYSSGSEIIAEYVEIESGKRNDRPQLALAMAHAKKLKATLLIAKLDRLARDAHFITGLMKARVDFIAADMPHANKLTVQLMAVFAEHEAQMISDRTKAALSAARARGVKLGSPNPHAGGQGNRAAARRRNAQARELAAALRDQGKTLIEIAAELQAKGIKTARGGSAWAPTQVARLLKM